MRKFILYLKSGETLRDDPEALSNEGPRARLEDVKGAIDLGEEAIEVVNRGLCLVLGLKEEGASICVGKKTLGQLRRIEPVAEMLIN